MAGRNSLKFRAVDFGIATTFHGLVFLKNKAKRDFVGATGPCIAQGGGGDIVAIAQAHFATLKAGRKNHGIVETVPNTAGYRSFAQVGSNVDLLGRCLFDIDNIGRKSPVISL